jgi:hypothetical protein
VAPDRSRDLFWGVGGKRLAPDPADRYTVIEIKRGGFSRGYTVTDSKDREWSVKFPPEAAPEVAASRILWGIGYHQPPLYYMVEWHAQKATSPNPQLPARFRASKPDLHGLDAAGTWSYYRNPFAGTRQLITQSQNRLVSVAVADGKLLWELPIKTPYEQNSVTPLVAGNLLLYAGLENPTIALRVSAAGGKWTATPAWRNEQVSMYMSSPAANGNTVFGLSNKNRGQFFALDAATGKTLWLGKGREAENASIVRAGDYLLLATTNSELIVAKASASPFEEVKRYTVADSAMWAHPAFTGRNIVVKDVDKLIVWGL